MSLEWSKTLELFTHEYFLISFLPISFLAAGFWMLFFERARAKRAPFLYLFLALLAGSLSAFAFKIFGDTIHLQNFWGKVAGEEFFKVFFAIIAMECVKQRFDTIAGGVVYGFTVGLGFAMAENIVYLINSFESVEFADRFWITFQGRFWSSTLLHGVTTATFGLFYAGAYLAQTVHKHSHESPLHALLVPFKEKNFWQIATFHISREHLLFSHKPTLTGHFSRGVIFEGFLVAVIVHALFNWALDAMRIEIAFFIAFGGMWFLKQKVEIVSSEHQLKLFSQRKRLGRSIRNVYDWVGTTCSLKSRRKHLKQT